MATIEAIYENGIFRPKAPVELENGQEVTLEMRAASAPISEEKHREMMRLLQETLRLGRDRSDEAEPEDGSINHDHYLYGAPKVQP